ncbi:unnamed protein product [Paramecium octaurelia]|uniref:Transmembrane protein n=1 Tax=Paramecium octaurelia TaxID=43137 RepID=A0A8S1TDZ5_PAROT|nr:unnamed protein product [Paramecium octaurelia]
MYVCTDQLLNEEQTQSQYSQNLNEYAKQQAQRMKSNRSNINRIAKWKMNQYDGFFRSSREINIRYNQKITIRLRNRIGKKYIPKEDAYTFMQKKDGNKILFQYIFIIVFHIQLFFSNFLLSGIVGRTNQRSQNSLIWY